MEGSLEVTESLRKENVHGLTECPAIIEILTNKNVDTLTIGTQATPKMYVTTSTQATPKIYVTTGTQDTPTMYVTTGTQYLLEDIPIENVENRKSESVTIGTQYSVDGFNFEKPDDDGSILQKNAEI